ncbi:hypothetical protein KBD34_02065 [Patescibacteria group bacterium]|nr:hypothetical protein [Patescibacteria group bacterium]
MNQTNEANPREVFAQFLLLLFHGFSATTTKRGVELKKRLTIGGLRCEGHKTSVHMTMLEPIRLAFGHDWMLDCKIEAVELGMDPMTDQLLTFTASLGKNIAGRQTQRASGITSCDVQITAGSLNDLDQTYSLWARPAKQNQSLVQVELTILVTGLNYPQG